MKTAAAKRFVIMLVIAIGVLPTGLAAKERRGATLVVTKLDGARVSGELIAVKPDALFLLNDSGRDESVDLAEIRTVRVVRKSRALPWAIGGFVTGAVEGSYLASRDEEDRNTGTTLLAIGIFGGAQALLGAGIGLALGADAVISFAGEPDDIVSKHLDRLKGYSREGRIRISASPEESRPAPSRLPRRPRFRFSSATTLNLGHNYHTVIDGRGTWRFPEDVPPGESGPYDVPVTQNSNRTGRFDPVQLGPFSLAYEWTEHWLTEIEVLFNSGSSVYSYALPAFVSTADGRTYETAFFAPLRHADFDSLLIGLGYRLVAPGPLNRITAEIGVAAGPAWLHFSEVSWGNNPAGRKTVLSARAHIACDYYFIQAASLGGFVSYRYLEARLPGMTLTDVATFHPADEDVPYTNEITRLTEVTFPDEPVSRSGLALGLRLTIRL